jgi:hypothetical protein
MLFPSRLALVFPSEVTAGDPESLDSALKICEQLREKL